MAVSISGDGAVTGVASVETPTTLSGLTIPTLGFGKVLQVVMETTSTAVSLVGDTNWTNTGFSASITPSSASSKILVFVSHPYLVYATGTTAAASIRLMRGATALTNPDKSRISAGGASGNLNTRGRWTLPYLDSPASTSLVTYSTQFACYSTNDRIFVQESSVDVATFILVEVGP